MADLEENGWSVFYSRLEIGSLGHFDMKVFRTLLDIFPLSKQDAKQVLTNLSGMLSPAPTISLMVDSVPVGM